MPSANSSADDTDWCQPTPNIMLAQSAVTSAAPPQLRLALGPDGNVILQQNIGSNRIQPQLISNSNSRKYSDSLKDSGLGSSQPSPDSTTPTIDSTTSTTTTNTNTTISTSNTTCNTSALLDQLNTGPEVKVPDIGASLAL